MIVAEMMDSVKRARRYLSPTSVQEVEVWSLRTGTLAEAGFEAEQYGKR